jgi:hypothetical protein
VIWINWTSMHKSWKINSDPYFTPTKNWPEEAFKMFWTSQGNMLWWYKTSLCTVCWYLMIISLHFSIWTNISY